MEISSDSIYLPTSSCRPLSHTGATAAQPVFLGAKEIARLTSLDLVGPSASRLQAETLAERCFSLGRLEVDRNPNHHCLRTPLRHTVNPEVELMIEERLAGCY
jgi:hypothetical protein